MIWTKEDPWERRYRLAADWYREHGHLQLPADYKAEGIWLAKWLDEQRQIRRGKRKGKSLTDDQISRLEAIGMIWENRSRQERQDSWQKQYQSAKAYYDTHGDLAVPSDYSAQDGKNLSLWLYRQRKAKKEGRLPEEQVDLLEAIGMVWDTEDAWETGYRHAERYYREQGDLNAPVQYVSSDGYALGKWLANQRNRAKGSDSSRSLSDSQKQRLEAIGMIWSPSEKRWMEGYRHAAQYLKNLGGEHWKTNYISPDGYSTGAWMRSQKRACASQRLSVERRQMLEQIGMQFGM